MLSVLRSFLWRGVLLLPTARFGQGAWLELCVQLSPSPTASESGPEELGTAKQSTSLFAFILTELFLFFFSSFILFSPNPLRNSSSLQLFLQSCKNTELLSLSRKGSGFCGVPCLCLLAVTASGTRILRKLQEWALLRHGVFLVSAFWISLLFFFFF